VSESPEVSVPVAPVRYDEETASMSSPEAERKGSPGSSSGPGSGNVSVLDSVTARTLGFWHLVLAGADRTDSSASSQFVLVWHSSQPLGSGARLRRLVLSRAAYGVGEIVFRRSSPGCSALGGRPCSTVIAVLATSTVFTRLGGAAATESRPWPWSSSRRCHHRRRVMGFDLIMRMQASSP